MQRTQHYFLLAFLIAIPGATAAWAGSISSTSGPDPLLAGESQGPCARLATGTDFVPGTDAQGDPVAPADVGVAKIPVPDQISVPLANRNAQGRTGTMRGRESPYVTLDGKKLAPLLNPPACPAH
jgi:hypothetical protein